MKHLDDVAAGYEQLLPVEPTAPPDRNISLTQEGGAVVQVGKPAHMRTRTPRRSATARASDHAPDVDPLERLLLDNLPRLYRRPLPQTAIPKLAKDATAVRGIEKLLKKIPTRHELYLGDARDMATLRDGSVHLAVTSPPYWTLKVYPSNDAQVVPDSPRGTAALARC